MFPYIACPIKKAAKHTASLTSNIEILSTPVLAIINFQRLGTAANVVRIDPVVYSVVINSEPMTPTANWASAVPTRLVATGSKVRWSRSDPGEFQLA